jgi:bifunctional ADP-heptose synthase (sugar kinase/adenylyltransferase)
MASRETVMSLSFGYCGTHAPPFCISVDHPDANATVPFMDKHQTDEDNQDKDEGFGRVGMGGTFDHLHAGHKLLLTAAAFVTRDELICGLTGKSSTVSLWDLISWYFR